MVQLQRTHDREIYLAENRYREPKELFKRIADLVENTGVVRPGCRITDVGCAAGEFIYYLRERFPETSLLGVDLLPELLAKARGVLPEVSFQAGSVLDEDVLPAESSDVTLLVGVHSIFDDFRMPFSNLLRWTRPGGVVVVAGLFNPHPVDVWVTYRAADRPADDPRELGWNLVSKASVSRYLDAAVGVGRYEFVPFELPFDLAPNPSDPVRTWTFKDAEGRRLFTNGLSLLCNIEILVVHR